MPDALLAEINGLRLGFSAHEHLWKLLLQVTKGLSSRGLVVIGKQHRHEALAT